MLPKEKNAVDHYMVELMEALKQTILVLLDYLVVRAIISSNKRDVIESNVTRDSKLITLFGMLNEKDYGWLHILSYLRYNKQSLLADKLQKCADEETDDCGTKRRKRSPLVEFSFRLAQYYQLNYAHFPTMRESPEHVKDVWVPLQVDGRREQHLTSDCIDSVELLSRLKLTDQYNVALVEGDPGMGKTCLAKKIAYNWAVNYGSSQPQPFSLVLAVPLRFVHKRGLFGQLAIDFFLSIGGGQLLKGLNEQILSEEINQLQSQLLVVLDGLNEYSGYDKSPFRSMFGVPFNRHSTSRNQPPPMVNFQVLITSRPYACRRRNHGFPLLRFVILPLNDRGIKLT